MALLTWLGTFLCVNTPLIICGDFNQSNISWDNLDLEDSRDGFTRGFINIALGGNLRQLIDQPTRVAYDGNMSQPDIVLVNDMTDLVNIGYGPPLATSDHTMIFWTWMDPNPALSPPGSRRLEDLVTSYNFRRGDFGAISDELNAFDWLSILHNLNVEEGWNLLKQIIGVAQDKFIPRRHSGKSTQTLPNYIVTAIRAKHKAWNIFRRSRSPQNFISYKTARNRVVALLRKNKRNKFQSALYGLGRDPKKLFSFISRQGNGSLTGISDSTGHIQNDPDRIAQIFGEVFTLPRVSLVSPDTEIWSRDLSSDLTPFNDLCSLTELRMLLSLVREGDAPGSDGLGPAVLKHCASALALPVWLIFEKSWREAILPEDWKSANVIPIYKNKGSRLDPSNFRPISILSGVGKVLETIIKNYAQKQFSSLGILDRNQHGFTGGRSCLTALALTREHWTRIVDEGGSVDVIFVDFSRAFDMVDHGLLLRKLDAAGIQFDLLAWVRGFLSGRRQRTRYEDCFSEWTEIHSGVPQGSTLSPLLFNFFISDLQIPDDSITMIKYADDVKIFRQITDGPDHIHLQKALNTLLNWSVENGLLINPKKCAWMHMGRGQVDYTYSTETSSIDRVSSFRDLGVVVSDNFSLSLQCLEIAAKVRRTTGFLLRRLPKLFPDEFVIIYNAYIRPLFEFASSSWIPWLQKDLHTLEKAQDFATKHLTGLYDKCPDLRRSILGIEPLAVRRQRALLIDCFKIVNEIYDLRTEEFFEILPSPGRDLRRNRIFRLATPAHDYRRFGFSYLAASTVNSWTSNFLEMTTLDDFKFFIDNL